VPLPPFTVNGDLPAGIHRATLRETLDRFGTGFGGSVFWVRQLAALNGEQAAIEHWQIKRDGGQRGIVEIIPESP
jgi:hypothetical protein